MSPSASFSASLSPSASSSASPSAAITGVIDFITAITQGDQIIIKAGG